LVFKFRLKSVKPFNRFAAFKTFRLKGIGSVPRVPILPTLEILTTLGARSSEIFFFSCDLKDFAHTEKKETAF
jgi:hypothetical protein